MKRDTSSNDNGYGQVRDVESVNNYTVKNDFLILYVLVSMKTKIFGHMKILY